MCILFLSLIYFVKLTARAIRYLVTPVNHWRHICDICRTCRYISKRLYWATPTWISRLSLQVVFRKIIIQHTYIICILPYKVFVKNSLLMASPVSFFCNRWYIKAVCKQVVLYSKYFSNNVLCMYAFFIEFYMYLFAI